MQKRKFKRKKGKKSNNYFDSKTQQAIIEFQKEIDPSKRKKIFMKGIHSSFLKLIENIIFVYKFHTLGNVDALKNDCMSFLFESLEKFDASRGHAAFSYFGVMCKNWFIQRVKTHKKKNSLDVTFDKEAIAFLEKNNSDAVIISYDDLILKREFYSLLKDEIVKWQDKFEKEQEKKILEAIILLFDNLDVLALNSKKGIFLYLREITGLNTKQIVTNLAKFKKKYGMFKRKYLAGEV